MIARIFATLLGLVVSASVTDIAHASDMNAWKTWIQKLSHRGIVVEQGTIFKLGNAECKQFVAVFGTCFGNNAAAPYLIPVPPIGRTALDPHYAPAFTMPGKTGSPSNMFYRLADNDALVTIMSPPPRLAYLGYQSYPFTRSKDNYPADITGTTISPNPNRYEILGSVWNDINSVTIQNKVGSLWDGKPIVYITTSNANLAKRLVADAAASGLDSNRIFVEPIGANIITGTMMKADDLVTLFRYALPEDETASSRWLHNLGANILVYRTSLRFGWVARYPTRKYKSKRGFNEAHLTAPLQELATLLSAWLTAHQNAGTTTISPASQSSHVDHDNKPYGNLVGADCIAAGRSCLADNQDPDSYRTAVIRSLTGTNVAIFAGVNHTVTGNASYLSLSIYNLLTQTGVASASQTNPQAVGFASGGLTGSAEAVLKRLRLYPSASPALKAALPKLYVEFIARNCIWVPKHCVAIDYTSVPPAVPIAITQRAYIRPGSTTGANPDTMQGPFAIYQAIPQ